MTYLGSFLLFSCCHFHAHVWRPSKETIPTFMEYIATTIAAWNICIYSKLIIANCNKLQITNQNLLSQLQRNVFYLFWIAIKIKPDFLCNTDNAKKYIAKYRKFVGWDIWFIFDRGSWILLHPIETWNLKWNYATRK